ncbi:uncharacterized protein [Cherax quadricarinatus]|nr:uncharacterized protein LOC128696853 isoform X2 [Cherax quadricarinatus]XP_053644246.1 uncharacterized protein LOC128696853 isoform X2 [Cherax quadricarinatus]
MNLVTYVGVHWQEFGNGSRKKKFIWKEIASKLAHDGFSVTGDDCDRKWRNLKIRYMAVLEKQLSGEKTGYRIDYFDNIHSFLKDDPDTKAFLEQRRVQQESKDLGNHNDLDEEDFSDITSDGPMEWTDKSVQLLLDLLLEFRDWFTDKDPDRNDSTIWETVSDQMKMEGHQPGPEQCKRKWINLAIGFQHHKAEAEATGSVPLWPYYTRVRHIMNVIGLPTPDIEARNKLKRRIRFPGNSPKKKSQRYFKQEIEDIDDNLLEESIEEAVDKIKPSTSDGAPGRCVRLTEVPNSVILPGEVKEVCQRLERLEKNVAILHRLDRLEAKLDDATQQQEAQQQTNSLLTQVLSELSRLSRTLSTRYSHSGPGQDQTDLGAGITIVVPHSQHLE